MVLHYMITETVWQELWYVTLICLHVKDLKQLKNLREYSFCLRFWNWCPHKCAANFGVLIFYKTNIFQIVWKFERSQTLIGLGRMKLILKGLYFVLASCIWNWWSYCLHFPLSGATFLYCKTDVFISLSFLSFLSSTTALMWRFHCIELAHDC